MMRQIVLRLVLVFTFFAMGAYVFLSMLHDLHAPAAFTVPLGFVFGCVWMRISLWVVGPFI
jgi:hypothetical protein